MALRLFLVLALLLPCLSAAQDIDGSIDSETLLEKALPMVRDLYLHPDAVEPSKMLRAGLQALEHESPRLLVLEEDDGALRVQVDDSARVLPVDDVQDLAAVFHRFEAAALWIEPLLDDPEIDLDALRSAALAGALKTLDRHSRVIAGDRLDDFNTRFRGELVGIGARIGRRDGALRVVKPFADAPAGRAGLVIWDAITRIDGVATDVMEVDEAVDRIRGPEGVPVVLTVQRDGEDFPRAFVIVREKVLVPSVESALLSDDIGYVSIDHFSKKTSEEFTSVLAELQGRAALRGLVLDLRGNQGGSMIHAARIVNAFVDEGMLVQTEGPDRQRVQGLTWKVPAKPSLRRFEGPVVVLVDEDTASGSEIVAGGLKFLNRSLTLGSQTYGKGTVQKVYSLTDSVSMKLTVARYLLPGERYINGVGVTPDVMVGPMWLDPGNPSAPDLFREPGSLAGLEEGDGGLDERANPGAGRAPTTDNSNAAPLMRLMYPRVLASWSAEPETVAAEPGEEPTPRTGPPEERIGDARVKSTLPGDAGDAQYNDVELRLAHDLLVRSKVTDRRGALQSLAGPLVAEWQARQSERLTAGLAERAIPWTPSEAPRWLDRSPTLDESVGPRLLSPPPPLEVSLELPDPLKAGVHSSVTLVVRNTGSVSYQRVRAKIESSSGALDDATLLLGDLPPGAERRATVDATPSQRAESRIDVWRLYLLDDDGPLGGPERGELRTRGLAVQPVDLRVASEVVAEPEGTRLLTLRIGARNRGEVATGELRILVGDGGDERLERLERWTTLEPLPPGAEAEATLSLRYRGSPGVTLPLRVQAVDLSTGRSVILAAQVPVDGPVAAAPFRGSARVSWQELAERGQGSARLAGTVSAEEPLAAVEVSVGGDKIFSRRIPAGAEQGSLSFDVRAALKPGPNLVQVQTETAAGVSWTERAWVLGAP